MKRVNEIMGGASEISRASLSELSQSRLSLAVYIGYRQPCSSSTHPVITRANSFHTDTHTHTHTHTHTVSSAAAYQIIQRSLPVCQPILSMLFLFLNVCLHGCIDLRVVFLLVDGGSVSGYVCLFACVFADSCCIIHI